MAVYATLPRGHTFVCDCGGCSSAFATPHDDVELAEVDASRHGWGFVGMGHHYCGKHHGPRPAGISPETRHEIAETIAMLDQVSARIKATLVRLERG